MRRRLRAMWLVFVPLAAGCVSINFGRDFPSPDRQLIAVGKTDKAALEKLFGEPYQVGIDSGDPMWRWFYGHRDGSAEVSKDLAVRFNSDGTVKSYAFTSNFPDDMARLK